MLLNCIKKLSKREGKESVKAREVLLNCIKKLSKREGKESVKAREFLVLLNKEPDVTEICCIHASCCPNSLGFQLTI